MKSLFLLIAGCFSISFAQFSPKDSSLVKSLFFRTPDKSLFTQYISADDKDSITAGLLAAGNMPDSSYIPLITSLRYSAHPYAICFALAKFGVHPLSSSYLRKIIKTERNNELRGLAVETLGITGDNSDYLFILKCYEEDRNLPSVSLALYHFRLRKFKEDEDHQKILIEQLGSNHAEKIKNAAFALARGGNYNNVSASLFKIISADSFNVPDSLTLYYLYSLIKRIPPDSALLPFIISGIENSSPLIQIEAISCLSGYSFKGKSPFQEILQKNEIINPNVLVKLAQQVLLNTFDSPAAEILADELEKRLHNNTQPGYPSEQIIFALMQLAPEKGDQYIDRFGEKISRSGYYKMLQLYAMPDSAILKALIPEFPGLSLPERLKILNLIFTDKTQKSLRENADLKSYVKMQLKSREPALISTIAETITVEYFKSDSLYFTEEFYSILKSEINNPHYTEALIAIYNVLNANVAGMSQKLKSVMASSSLKAVSAIGGTQMVEPSMERQKLFEDIFKNAFTQNFAKIKTTAGEFTIRFFPNIAPVSSGNFIKLAKEGFFNGILFHRVVPGFVIQAGDRTGTGYDGPGYEIISEFSWLQYNPYTLGMASAGADTEGSQWFVTQNEFPHLNKRYTIFGEVISGYGVVQTISQEVYIQEVTVY